MAAPLHFDIAAESGIMRGDVSYRIGGNITDDSGHYTGRFPISKLEFPLRLEIAQATAKIEIFDRLVARGMLRKNINSEAGTFKDSDWGIYALEYSAWTDPNSLDIYSESTARLKTWAADMSLRLRIFPELHWIGYYLGAGYLHQQYKYVIFDLNQWYPSLNEVHGSALEHDFVAGAVLSYETILRFPYLELATRAEIDERFQVEARIAYSPHVTSSDLDNHLLRDKISLGSCSGQGYLLSIGATYSVLDNLFMGMQFEMTALHAEGRQKQYLRGNWLATVDQEIDSTQLVAMISLGGRF